MTIQIQAKYLAHEGGTKFYETICFLNEDAKSYILVRRWGKIDARYGNGEVKVEAFGSATSCLHAAYELRGEKEKRGYHLSSIAYGLHEKTSVRQSQLRDALNHHYKKAAVRDNLFGAITRGDDMTSIAAELDETQYEVIDDIVEEKPMPEPDRSEDWASW